MKNKTSNTNSKIILIPEIGEINISKNPKAKNLSISVRPKKGIKVSIPKNVDFSRAENFVYQKIDWLKKAVEKVKKIEKRFITFDESTIFKTKYHQLQIQKSNVPTFKANISNGFIQIIYPETIAPENAQLQQFIRKAIVFTLRKEATYYLPKRVWELAEKYNFKFRKVSVKDTKTRWGSCSHDNNINLSIQLMRLPEHLIDYVILHELCHTIEKNHQKPFWDLLEKVTGNAKYFAWEIKQYRTEF